jgi:hypothetical protein
LNLNVDTTKPSEKQRKEWKTNIISVCQEFGLVLENPEEIQSRRDFNRYRINYSTEFSSSFIRNSVVIETAVFLKSFPTEIMEVSSLIHDFLLANGMNEEIKEYNLVPFKIAVQSKERTFIDKVFALVDYYIGNDCESHSRHIYDLYKLYPLIKMNSEFEKLVNEVYEIRKPHKTSYSAKDGINFYENLTKIMEQDFYRDDYDKITKTILYEQIEYQEAITVISKIIDDGYFNFPKNSKSKISLLDKF